MTFSHNIYIAWFLAELSINQGYYFEAFLSIISEHPFNQVLSIRANHMAYKMLAILINHSQFERGETIVIYAQPQSETPGETQNIILREISEYMNIFATI